jgi:hypothetical protein
LPASLCLVFVAMGRKLLNFFELKLYAVHAKIKQSINCLFLKKAIGISGINSSLLQIQPNL